MKCQMTKLNDDDEDDDDQICSQSITLNVIIELMNLVTHVNVEFLRHIVVEVRTMNFH